MQQEQSSNIYRDRSRRRREAIESFQAKHYRKRTVIDKITDKIATFSGSIAFLLINVFFFAFWLIVNSGISGIKPFDPFPYVLLTSIVSLEAIVLSIFVLISQNRQSRISDLRQEVDLQINLIAEEEITKMIHLIAGLYSALKIDVEEDKELKKMLEPTDWDEIEKRLEDQLQSET
jgi:uncharacterized membrane protein